MIVEEKIEFISLTAQEDEKVKLLHKMFCGWVADLEAAGIAKNKKHSSVDEDSWDNIIQKQEIALSHIARAIKTIGGSPKFLDVGCGSGTIMKTVELLGVECSGIEFNKEYLPYTKEMDVRYENALETPESFFNDFDIIYMYRPIDEQEKALKLLDRVISNMKPNSILITFNYQIEMDILLNKFTELEKLVPFNMVFYKN